MIRFLLGLILLFNIHILRSQVLFTGYIKDSLTGQPIRYAQISVIGNNVPHNNILLSDKTGFFEINFKTEALNNDFQLKIDAKGYISPPFTETVITTRRPGTYFLQLINLPKKQEHKSSTSQKFQKNDNNNNNLNDLIDNLFEQDDIVRASLQQLLLRHKQRFLQKQVDTIINAYEVYISKVLKDNLSPDYEVINYFKSLLTILSKEQNYSSDDITAFIKTFHRTIPDGGIPTLIFGFIKESRYPQSKKFFEQLVISRDVNFYKNDEIKDSALQYFLNIDNLKEFSFYMDYVDQFKGQHGQMYIPFYHVLLGLAPNRKQYVIKLLNNKELVDSFFKAGVINNEGSFYRMRKEWNQFLSKFISTTDLDKTYFFSILCPCYLPAEFWREGRPLKKCDSTHMTN